MVKAATSHHPTPRSNTPHIYRARNSKTSVFCHYPLLGRRVVSAKRINQVIRLVSPGIWRTPRRLSWFSSRLNVWSWRSSARNTRSKCG